VAESRHRREGHPDLTVRWGILSTARINQRLIAAARSSAIAEVVAVAGRDPARVETYARENGIGRAYASYDDLLADPELDAVYISLPNSLHAEWSIRALNAGKHVLCEKPMSRRASDVEAAFDAAERNGRLLMEAFMYRHHPQTAALVAAVSSGVVGDLRLVRAVYGYNLVRMRGEDASDVRLDPELDGGALQDLGCYCVSVARLLAGEPRRVYGVQALGRRGVDLLFAGSLEFEHGVVGQVECALSIEPRVELEVIGSAGRLVVREPFRIEQPGIDVFGPDGREERIACEPADAYALQLENMSAAIAEGTPPLLGRADAVGQARAVEALFASAEQGVSVALSSIA
jgi:predicted dehydrogenase